jgi:succinyl-diaminopimelate desuccinylase
MSIENKIEELREGLISSVQEILRIKSVEEPGLPGAPYGEGVSSALDCALDISRQLGFSVVNMDGYVGYAEYGFGEDYVGVLGHLDVVPEGEGWLHPPYGAEIHDGKVYARGALDDKGPIIAALYGLKAIMELKLPLTKRVRIIFGTNEETGCKEIEYYLKNEKAPVSGFTPDGDYPVIYAEKGLTTFNIVKDLKKKQTEDIIIKHIKGGTRANIVPEYAEAGIITNNNETIFGLVSEFSKKSGYDLLAQVIDNTLIIKSRGVSAHGAVPQKGKNAIMQLFEFLGTLTLGEGDISDFINFCNKNIGMNTYGELFGVGLEDEPSGKLSFNTGVVEMNEDKIHLVLNLRYPVTYTIEDMMEPFNARIDGTGIRIENFDHQKALYFPKDHILIKTLQSVYTEQTGQEAELLAIGGGTYAKEMPNIVAFGPLFPGQPDIIHQPNECIVVEDLILNAKIYAHAIYELAK